MLLTALAAPGLQPPGLQPLLPASLAFVLVMSSRWSAWETLRDHVASQEGPVWGYRGVGTLLGTEKPGDPLLSPSCAARPDVGPPGARQSWESSHLKSERTGPGADSNSSSRTTAEGPASTWGRALRAGAAGMAMAEGATCTGGDAAAAASSPSWRGLAGRAKREERPLRSAPQGQHTTFLLQAAGSPAAAPVEL